MEKQGDPPAYASHTPVAGQPTSGTPVAGQPVAGQPVAGQPVHSDSYQQPVHTDSYHQQQQPVHTDSYQQQHVTGQQPMYTQPQHMQPQQQIYEMATPQNIPQQPYGMPQSPQTVPGHSVSPLAQQPYGQPPQTFSPQPQHAYPHQQQQGVVGQPGMVYQKPEMMHSNSQPGFVSHNSTGMVTQQPGAGNAPQAQVYQSAVPISTLGESAAPIDCPSCHQRGLTSISHVTGDCTHLWALGAFFVTCCLCCVPYLIDSFKDTVHKCSKCGVTVAKHKKSGGTQVMAFA